MPRTFASIAVLVVLASGAARAQNPYFPMSPSYAVPAAPSKSADGANPYFPPQPQVIPFPPAKGEYVPFFGQAAPANRAIAQSAPVIPNSVPLDANPFFTLQQLRQVAATDAEPYMPYFGASATAAGHAERLRNLCEPGSLGQCYQPNCSSAPGCTPEFAPTYPQAACKNPTDDELAKKWPLWHRIRYGPVAMDSTWWVSTEYLLWHISGDRVGVPLVASASTTNLPALLADPIGSMSPIRTVQRYGAAPGMRLCGGYWGEESCCVRWGLEWSAFMLERHTSSYSFDSSPNGLPIILRPIIDVRTGQASLVAVSFPGAATGSLAASSGPLLWGGEFNAVRRINEGGGVHWDMIAGLRYLDLDENFLVTQNSTLIGNGLAGFGGQTIRAPSSLSIVDEFDTRNHFFGGQIGSRIGGRLHRLTIDATAKVALGWSHESANASGSTTLRTAGASSSLAGGILQVPTNSGHLTGDDLAVVPEVGLQVGYDLTNWLRFTAGYSALYWSQVARPGEQIRSFVNPVQLPSSLQYNPPGSPSVTQGSLNRDGFWVSGVSFGVMLKY